MVFVNANMVPSLIQWVRQILPASQSLRNFAYCICTGVFLALYSFSGKICPVLGTSNQDSNLNEIYQFLQSLYVFSLPSYNMTKVLPNSLKLVIYKVISKWSPQRKQSKCIQNCWQFSPSFSSLPLPANNVSEEMHSSSSTL